MTGNVLARANLAYLYEHGRGVVERQGSDVHLVPKAATGDKDTIRNLRILRRMARRSPKMKIGPHAAATGDKNVTDP